MNREQFHQWLDTPQGRALTQNEAGFLKKIITLSYTQTILQLGCLGWEDQFIDCLSYRGFIVLDDRQWSCQDCIKVNSPVSQLPIASDSIDMIILPHLLEFESNRYQVLREVERVLKPEAELIILGFNPWSVFSLSQRWRHKSRQTLGRTHFISRLQMINWLHLLNFEAEVVAGFHLRAGATSYSQCVQNKTSLVVTAYAIHAIKRQFNIIPLQPHWTTSRQFEMANGNVSALTTK